MKTSNVNIICLVNIKSNQQSQDVPVARGKTGVLFSLDVHTLHCTESITKFLSLAWVKLNLILDIRLGTNEPKLEPFHNVR